MTFPVARIRASTLAAALVLGAGPLAADTVTLRVASFSPAGSFFNSQVLEPFLDRVVADSEGTLAYQMFPGGTLGRGAPAQMKLVADGVADMAFVVPAYTPGSFDRYGISEIPGAASTGVESSVGLWRAWEQGLLEVPEGVEVIGLTSSGPNQIHFSGPVANLDGLAGKRVRAAGAAQISALTALGAVPVSNLSAGEVAEAVSRGVVDGTLMDWTAIRSFRVDQVVSHHVEIGMGTIALMLPMNAATWAGLPAPARAAFEKHMGEAFARAAGAAFDASETARRADALARDGATLMELTAEEEARIDDAFARVAEEWVGGDAGKQAALDSFNATVASIRAGN
ncbi:MAG: TRAP transporter substrate-binding protein [Rhodobacteraceae bacterium]|nr:TRAP transporter substrate-binding protein [Paracoccaceae bacterium]